MLSEKNIMTGGGHVPSPGNYMGREDYFLAGTSASRAAMETRLRMSRTGVSTLTK